MSELAIWLGIAVVGALVWFMAMALVLVWAVAGGG